MTAVIIDDELSAREALRSLIETFITGVKIVDEADCVVSGKKAIETHQPDIVFLDINMPSGTGFDLLEQLEQINFFLVFVTAYDQYAIKAIKFSALDYLLKPVDLQELRSTIDRIQKLNSSGNNNYKPLLENYRNNTIAKSLDTIALPTIEGFDIVKIKDIIRCEGERNYTTIFFTNGSKLVISKTLKEYEKLLQEHNFLRIFQSHLINLTFVKKYIRGRGGFVLMADDKQIPVSREKKAELLKRIGG